MSSKYRAFWARTVGEPDNPVAPDPAAPVFAPPGRARRPAVAPIFGSVAVAGNMIVVGEVKQEQLDALCNNRPAAE